jgi:hypothetical protein
MWTVNLGNGETFAVESLDEVEEVDLDEVEVFFDGARLTEARAEEIARQISRRNGLKGGRPSKPAAERASVQKAVRFTPAEAEQLAALARSRGVRESDVIRGAVLRELGAA